MNHELAKKVADAVLYEGYKLYPYRPSALKNRQRWTFGILYPPQYSEVRGGTEHSGMHSEFLLEGQESTSIQVELRFLQIAIKQVSQLNGERLEPVKSLAVDNCSMESWDEGVERSVNFESSLSSGVQQHTSFHFSGNCETESFTDSSGRFAGLVNRKQSSVMGTISIAAEKISDRVLKTTIDVTNSTSLPECSLDRNMALLHSLLSTHLILTVNNGAFVSLLDPPESLRKQVSECKNIGNFPVLVGLEGEHDMLLCSPIILYDYPQIAPESSGDFYDATEIDEMLTLRVMTLTDEEKEEMRLSDEKVRNLLQRTEQDARELLMRTHGTMRTPNR